MDKIKDMMHGGNKEGEHTTPTTTGGYGNEAGTGDNEKKGMFGLGGHKKEGEEGEKKHGFMGMGGDSSSSSDEEREGAAERNRLRRERRAQRQQAQQGQQADFGTTGVDTALPQ